MPSPILPPRYEAWDGDEDASGTYLDVQEINDWAKAVLAECLGAEPIAAKYLTALIAHLDYSSNT